MAVSDLAGLVASGIMVVGGALPYIPQYKAISEARNARGFSTMVCLVLLISQILRVLFWFGKRFETPLLLQSLCMIVVQLVLLKLCVTLNAKEDLHHTRSITDFNLDDFWKWTHFTDYLIFLGAFTAVFAVLGHFMNRSSVYVEAVGLVALILESTLGFPQLIKNYQAHSTAGMSLAMIGGWFCGDVFKTVYFFTNNSPLQFLACGIIQILVDLAIFYQVQTYK